MKDNVFRVKSVVTGTLLCKSYIYRQLFLCVLHITMLAYAKAQATTVQWVVVDSISIEGNKTTRAAWLLRELEFQQGDTLSTAGIGKTLERNRLRLLNTGVLTDARINIRKWDTAHHLHLHVVVKEAWLWYPVPVFDLPDRNFNVWWHEFDHSLQRVNYGVDLTRINLTGRADPLKMTTTFGYTNRYNISYRRPGLNTKQTLGLEASFTFNRARETAFRTVGNKLQFYRNPEDWQIRRILSHLRFTWRPKLYATHFFSVGYVNIQVSDTIASSLNPHYFGEGRRQQQYALLQYRFVWDRLDLRAYPLRGWWLEAELTQDGFLPKHDLHLSRIRLDTRRYYGLSNRWSMEHIGRVRWGWSANPIPYANNQALGYGGDVLRGYEYYVADGISFALLRNTLRYQLLNRTVRMGKGKWLSAYSQLPLKIFLTAHTDVGGSRDPYHTDQNPYANRTLWGQGVGIHVIAYYDKVMRLEWSRNHLGETGIFLGINTGL